MRKELFLILLATLLLSSNSDGQYEVSVTEITVWARVTNGSGSPVTGLKREDFEILEDGKIQPLTCFEEVERKESENLTRKESTAATPAAPHPKFILFLDLFNMSPAEYLRVRPRIEEFLSQIQARNSEVMAATLTPKARLGIVVPFTSKVSLIRSFLLKASANGTRDSNVRNNLRNIRFLLEQNAGSPDLDWVARRAYQMAQSYAREEESRSELSIDALQSFGVYLSRQITNHEHMIIIYVSGGFNADPGRQYFDIINDYLQRQGEGIDTVDFATKFPTSVRETKFDVRTMVKNSVGKLNKLDMTVYSINTRGMYDSSDNIDVSRSEFAQWDNSYLQDYQESLTQIAEETGGSAFQNSQNFKKGFDLLLADLSHQYELCYHSPQHDRPGKYHKIEVRVSRKGLDVRFRRGYVD